MEVAMTTAFRQGAAQGLFHDLVCDAERQARIELPHMVEGYLVLTLLRHLNMHAARALYQTLAPRLAAIIDPRARASTGALRDTGDACLMLAGLFPEQAHRRHVNVGYFVDIGQTAYAKLAATDSGGSLFAELRTWFPGLIDVLQAIRGRERAFDAMSAYETWQATGSRQAGEQLPGVPIRTRQKQLI